MQVQRHGRVVFKPYMLYHIHTSILHIRQTPAISDLLTDELFFTLSLMAQLA